MAPALSQPLLLFCQAILLGMAAALLYDLLRAFRLRLPRLTSALDILYCMAAGLAVFLFMLRRAQGQLRLYLLLGGGGRRCAVFHRLLPVFAAGVGFLGGYLHFCASDRHSPAGMRKICVKKSADGEKISFILFANVIQ